MESAGGSAGGKSRPQDELPARGKLGDGIGSCQPWLHHGSFERNGQQRDGGPRQPIRRGVRTFGEFRLIAGRVTRAIGGIVTMSAGGIVFRAAIRMMNPAGVFEEAVRRGRCPQQSEQQRTDGEPTAHASWMPQVSDLFNGILRRAADAVVSVSSHPPAPATPDGHVVCSRTHRFGPG